MRIQQLKAYSLCVVAALGPWIASTGAADILYIYSADAEKQVGEDRIKSFIEGLGHTVTYLDDNNFRSDEGESPCVNVMHI